MDTRNILQLTDAYRHLVFADVVMEGNGMRRIGTLTTHYLHGEDEHTFATFTYTFAGQTTEFCFWEGMNQTVKVDGNMMFLIDSEGDEVPLLLYNLQRLELDPRDPFSGALS